MKNLVLLVIPLLLTLTGCLIGGNYDETLSKYAAQYATEVELAQKYLAQLKAHDLADIEQHVDASLKGAALHDNLEKVAAYFPASDPTHVKLIGAYRNEILNAEAMSTTRVDYEYDFSGKSYAADVILKGEKPNFSILGLSVTALVGPLEEINKFTLQGKGWINYAVLALMCIIPLFTLFALVVCVRTPMQRRKWLWVLFILCGVVGVTLDWTQGSVTLNPLSVVLFGASFSQSSPYSPVFLQFALPLGAIVFLGGRKRWMTKSAPLAGPGPIA